VRKKNHDLENPPKNKPNQHPSTNDNPRNLQHGNGIALSRHARESVRAAFEVCGEGGEDLVLL
jgi:hypothetical protein